jgi:hypothetical protein
MPDSLPPPGWGLAPFDERDLDAVLAGKTADVPVALRPVADVLAALRADPVPAELHGEANAMAEFRALELGHAGRPPHPAGPSPTLPLEASPAGKRARSGRPPARHRGRPRRRGALRRAVLRPAALSGAVAAAVIAFAVLLTGNFVGSFRDIAHMATPSARTPSATGSTGHSPAPGVEATSAGRETTASPSAPHSTASALSPSQTCRAYYTSLMHPQGPSAWATRPTLWQQVTELARTDNPVQVYLYCARYMKDLFPAGAQGAGPDQAPAHTGPGSQDTGDGGAANSPAGAGSGSISSGQVSNGDAAGNGP